MEVSDIRYARVDGLRIAYQEFGGGPPAVYVPPIVSNIDVKWDHEYHRRLLEHLGSFLHVVHFDKRGIGVSDRFEAQPTLDDRIDDIGAVMDAMGWERAHVFGVSEGADMALHFAVRHPERVEKLALLCGAGPTTATERIEELSGDAHRDFADIAAEFFGVVEVWGEDAGPFARLMAPSKAHDPAYLRWANRLNRLSASPGDFMSQLMSVSTIEGSLEPEKVQSPTIVVHLTGDLVRPIGNGRVLAEQIPNSTLVEVDGHDHLVYSLDNWRDVIDPMIEFLTGLRPPLDVCRSFAVVVFTDIVGSTPLVTSLGDTRYRELIEEHDLVIHRTASAHRGRVVKSTGDGMLGVFDSPSAAVDAARSMRGSIDGLGLVIRVGIHAGEIEEHANGDISGFAVNLAARVEQAAGDGAILVSSTVREMLLGGDVELRDAGPHGLKGFEEPWTLFEVV